MISKLDYPQKAKILTNIDSEVADIVWNNLTAETQSHVLKQLDKTHIIEYL